MSTKAEILKFLDQNTGKYISGPELAKELNISRNAIWKAVEKLKEEGFPIESKSHAGYRLASRMDILSKDVIESSINFPHSIVVEDSVSSTNTLAKANFKGERPLIVIANSQTQGRGRLGRSFYSPKDTGIYLSYAFKPSFDISKSSLVTLCASLAVALAMEDVVNISPKIKWVNDIYLNNKKIAGILTEASMSLEGGEFESIVIGIGLNCFTEKFPEFERNTPGSIGKKNGYSRNDLISSIIYHLHDLLEKMDPKEVVFEYKRRCNTLGKVITIYRDFNNPNEKGVKARAYDIDENGGLVVEYLDDLSGHLYTITSGEVSVR